MDNIVKDYFIGEVYDRHLNDLKSPGITDYEKGLYIGIIMGILDVLDFSELIDDDERDRLFHFVFDIAFPESEG